MAWSALGHGLLFIMSMMPTPMGDGVSILKWTLVTKGSTEIAADEIIRRVDWGIIIICGIIGLGLLAMKMWIAGIVLIGIGTVFIGIAAGKMR